MNRNKRSKVTDGLHVSAEIVKKISEFLLSSGKNVSEEFAIEGVSFWIAAQPDLALHIFPPLLFKYTGNQYKIFHIKNWMKSIKYQFKEFKKIFSSHIDYSCSRSEKDIWLLLSTTDYIYRDTLQPLEDEILKSCPDIHVESYASMRKKKLHTYSLSEAGLIYKKYINYRREFKLKSDHFFKNDFNRLCSILPEISKINLYEAFYWFFNVFVQRNIINAIIAQYWFKYLKPKKIISGDVADPLNRIYTEVGKKAGISIIDLQFGIYDETSVEWMFCSATKIAVWGKYFSTLFEKVHYIDPDRLVVTGSPRFDYLVEEKQVGYSRNDSNANNRIQLLFASMYTSISDYDANYDVNSINAFKKIVIDTVKKFDKIHLVIKPHPLEDISWIADYDNENITILDKKSDIRKHILESDIFLTFGSTATFDALLRKKLILSADTPGLVWWDDIFLKYNASIPICSKAELISVLQNFINNRNIMLRENNSRISNFLSDKLFNNENKASLRVISLALNI
ncbi:hypothetical protein KACHI17_12480 [Sediminibacterium sp. KACHI17]|uniref:Capsule polysaccharide biosynthesis protein n=1 Tax=Sediminibacterium sp. KACHI17 TaxID=1751071 RepID=A0AAT9GI57_9BACT